ncbi:hypothetical protein [Vulcanisaeta thermophila]|uniref:hypothetical protein n=1 Tax=Vulcanisaeta thermophila TaxID=867917 RepID=UPI000853CD84|nr:hypothetical protein [Vulcanisaeta thermophila]
MEIPHETRIRSIMQILHSLSAIDRSRAVRVSDIARLAGMRVEDVVDAVNKLRVLGYVNVEGDYVHLTQSAIIKLSSIYC